MCLCYRGGCGGVRGGARGSRVSRGCPFFLGGRRGASVVWLWWYLGVYLVLFYGRDFYVSSMVVVKTNPTNVSTTLCAVHDNLRAAMVATKSDTLTGTRGVRGCCNFTRPVDKGRLLAHKVSNTRELKIGFAGGRTISVSCRSNKFSIIASSSGGRKYGTMLLTANDEQLTPDVRNLARFRNGKIDCYTIYSTFFCEGGGINILNSNRCTLRRTGVLTGASGDIAIFAGNRRPATMFPSRFAVIGRPLSDLANRTGVRGTILHSNARIGVSNLFMTCKITSSTTLTRGTKTIAVNNGVEIGSSVVAGMGNLFTTNSYANNLLRMSGTINSNTTTNVTVVGCIGERG